MSLMKLDRRVLANFDWVLLILTLGLAGVGLINLYSATATTGIYLRQAYWLGLGLLVMLAAAYIPYQRLDAAAYAIFLINVLLLVAVLFVGKTSGGSRRWLGFGPFTFQPSELIKITLALALARYCQRLEDLAPLGFRELILPLLAMAVPAVLIVKQPDLGTALLILAIGASILLFNGIRWQVLSSLTVLGLAGLVLSWDMLKPYQKKRVLTFLDPENDPLGAGYHVIQSKIAIGSGGLWGKGFTQGTQSQLNFIPEHHTDFAFSVLAEEWGFVGCLVVIILFGLILLWGLNVTFHAKDRFGRLLALGIVSLFFWQFVVNVGMVTGFLPVVGIPLPFISYGGSSAVVNFLALGLLMNVSRRRFVFNR